MLIPHPYNAPPSYEETKKNNKVAISNTISALRGAIGEWQEVKSQLLLLELTPSTLNEVTNAIDAKIAVCNDSIEKHKRK